jgi:hypothetical protein
MVVIICLQYSVLLPGWAARENYFGKTAKNLSFWEVPLLIDKNIAKISI